MGLRVRKDDVVVVLAGKDRGKRGKVLRVDPARQRAVVQGVNLVKRWQRRTQQNPKGGQIETEAPVALSNLNVYCEKAKKSSRFRTEILKDGTKTRTTQKGGVTISHEK